MSTFEKLLTPQQKNKAKETAGKACFIYWVLCSAWFLYDVPTLYFLSMNFLIPFTIGFFLIPIVCGGVLYLLKVKLPLNLFCSLFVLVSEFLIAYPIYKIAEYVYTKIYW